MGRRFVDGIWIQQRMQRKDDRIARELRTRTAVVDVVLEPTKGEPRGPVVTVTIAPKIVDGGK